MKSNDPILLQKFNIAPLDGSEQSKFIRMDPEYLEQFKRIESLFTHASGGCLLVTGYRGVGKTSFINSVLHKAGQELRGKNNTQLLTVRLNLARGYSTDKLLRRMVRELFFELDRHGLYDYMPENIKHQFLLAFLRTSNKMKQALSEGIKEAITQRTSQTDTKSNTYTFEPSIGIKDLSAALGSMEHSRQRSVTAETEKTRESTWDRGVELEFLEYDDEIAESDLSALVSTLTKYVESISAGVQMQRKYRRPEFFWKRMPVEYRLFGRWSIRNYVETPYSIYQQKQFRIVFVFDEIDKMSLSQAEEIFRSLKNLFLQGNAFFVMIAGKDFYFHWRLNSTMEDDALFGLFTDVIHVPLFTDAEFKSMAQHLICQEGAAFPPELFTHLLYKAKGTPREFLRELTHFVSWEGDFLQITGFDKGTIKLSQRLYPYIERVYNQRLQAQHSIDAGMKDHLRRRLHNWLHAMVLKVVFTQDQILRIQSIRPQSQDQTAISYETLLAEGAEEDLCALIDALLALPKPVLQVKRVLDGIIFYTFTDEFNKYLYALDTTGVGVLRSESDQIQRNVLERLFKVPDLLQQGKAEEAGKILDSIPASIITGTPLEEQVAALHREVQRSSQIQLIRHLLERNDFALAEDRARALLSDFSEKDDQVRMLFYEALLKRASDESKAAFLSEYEFRKVFNLVTKTIQAIPGEPLFPADLSALYEQLVTLQVNLNKVAMLSADGEKLIEKDWQLVQKELTELPEAARRYPPIAQLQHEVDHAIKASQLLLSAKELIGASDLSGALDVLSRISPRRNKQINNETRALIESVTRALDLTAQMEQLYKSGEVGLLSQETKRYEELARDLNMSTGGIQVYRDWLLIQSQIEGFMNQVSAMIAQRDLEAAWDIYDEIKVIAKASLHKDIFRRLTNATLEKARIPAQELLQEAAEKSQGGVVKASRGSSEGLLYQLRIDDVIQILDPLLQRDPQNARAQTLIDTLKSAIQIQ